MIKNDELSIKIMESRLLFNKKINERIIDFINMGKSRNDSLFIELSFCILTANTSAEMGIRTQRIIMGGFIEYSREQLSEELKKAKYRFYNKRADYIVNARFMRKNLKKLISTMDHFTLREYLVNNVKGHPGQAYYAAFNGLWIYKRCEVKFKGRLSGEGADIQFHG